ncbi:MAG: tRNA guanosine(15) transglycosylase TgtA [Euryarchaeota archaeon]|jgi:7-cyano-7-deazaguanine tRNA-ribosyltransferase|nr:tRNA guanosine(15) transglycosylase TgtA [Euryarchaeota archaeon]
MANDSKREAEPCRDGDHGKFEVKTSDGWARLGLFHTNTHKLKTPTLLPVVNPNIQAILPSEMWNMGFEALITNSYIIWKGEELKAKALDEGVHKLLNYPGVVMTDSGVFQQYVYGDVEVGEVEVVEFQRDIGVDIATMMDVFGRPDMSREELEDAVAVTAARGPAALEAAGKTLLNGPIQGGTHADLRFDSAQMMSGMDFSVHPIGGIVPIMENQRYRELIELIVASKAGLTPERPVHLFGCGHPLLFPICVALGVDLFDSAAYALFAKDDRLLTPTGTVKLAELIEWPHLSPALFGNTPEEVRKLEKDAKIELLARHNLHVTAAELARCREAIRNGTIWNLVEERSHCNPELREATLWLYDNMPDDLILNTHPCRQGGVRWSTDMMSHPRIIHAGHWLNWTPPPVDHLGNNIPLEQRVVVVLHRNTGPWRESAGSLISKIVRDWPQVIPVIYTPIGLIPFQLEDLNPFAHILGPDGLWDAILPDFIDEAEIEEYVSMLTEQLFDNYMEKILLHNLDFEDELLLERLEELIGEPKPAGEGRRGDVKSHHQRFAICDKISLFTGLDYEVTHSIANDLTFIMSRTRRVNNVLLNDVHLFSQRLTDGGLSLTTDGAKWIYEMMNSHSEQEGLPLVVLDSDAEPFVRDGRNVMHGFIVGQKGLLKSGMPCLIINEVGDLLAHGISQCGPRELLSFCKGIAVKVRGGVTLIEDTDQ